MKIYKKPIIKVYILNPLLLSKDMTTDISHTELSFQNKEFHLRYGKNIISITKDNTADLHFYMMATHKKIQENTDFQYICNAGQI